MTVDLTRQAFFLMVLAIPIASISWTVTHEEVFREPREWCVSRSKDCRRIVQRKFFYLFTCEYCFSHYVTAVFLALSKNLTGPHVHAALRKATNSVLVAAMR